MRRFLIILLALLLISCAAPQELIVGALKGPSSMGMVETEAAKTMQLLNSPDEIIGKITSGEADVAMLPLNMASILYNKTQGEIRLLAINTIGNLYMMGEALEDVAQLKGKRILSAGQNASPMYVLELLLKDVDVQIEYLPTHSDVVAAASENKADYYVLPEPFVTLFKSKVGGEVALDLAELYEEKTGFPLTMGAVVTTEEKLKTKGKEIRAFLKDYKESVGKVLADPQGASELIEKFGIIEKADLARQSISGAGLVFESPKDLSGAIQAYFELLMENNPKALGGSLPGEDFYADF
ncbi:MAG: ABC transporter substrate-binding protein [Tissierellia bacterium]|nr:ABC transporter substrate-binding protein [Tissierellia bacterium]